MEDEPNYGHVWYPNQVSVGWAPYSYGYWNYVGPWGWTWVDYSPWGFAPFHYGRWNYFGGRWGWCPGPIGGYPVYGPAFVGFLGGRGGFGFGVGIGVGWFPLGFGEIYRPWYHYRAGGTYIRNINIHNTYIRNVNNIGNRNFRGNYAYARNPNAVTATSHNAFVNGQLVNRGSARVTAASLRGAQVSNRVGGLTPTRASYVGAVNARGRVSTPPASVQNRAVMARTAPAAGASHMPVRTISPSVGANRGFNNNRAVGNNGAVNSGSRPPSAQNNTRTYNNDNINRSNRPATNYQNRGASNSAPTMRSDRPSYAGSNGSSVNSQGAARYNNNRPPSANAGRSYDNRGASSQRTYSAPQQRTNSAPSRTYSAPQRSAPAPSRGSSAPSHGSSGGSHPSGGGGNGGGSHPHGRGR